MSDPVCVCGTCWDKDPAHDPKDRPTVAPWFTFVRGTVRVALPCVVVAEVDVGRRVEVESECEFWGHTLSEALAKADRHRRAGARYCEVAAKHAEHLVLPTETAKPATANGSRDLTPPGEWQ